MKRFTSLNQVVSLQAGTAVLLLALALLLPRSAEGGCSHLVKPRTDPGRLSSLTERWVRDLAGEADKIPAPVTPRPCSGALCSGQPAAPAVPAVYLDARLNPWAWCASVPGLALMRESVLFAETNEIRPTRLSFDVFHPPRPTSPA
jgi:hypothetical protein